MDCMGCGVCIGVCPTKSLKMVSRESQDEQQAAFDYCVAHVEEKKDLIAEIALLKKKMEIEERLRSSKDSALLTFSEILKP